MAAIGRDDAAAGQEDIGHGHRLIQETAGVVAEVQNDALEFPFRFPFRRRQDIDQAVDGPLVEAADANVGIGSPALEAYRRHHDQRPPDRHGKGRRVPLPGDGYAEPSTDLSPQARDHLRSVESRGLLIVDMGDHVTLLEAGARRRGAGQHIHHLHIRPLEVERYADAAEALAHGPVVAGFLDIGVAAVFVQPG